MRKISRIIISLSALAIIGEAQAANVPSWWHTRGLVNTNLVKNDYAPANIGQLKNVAYQTWVEVTNQVGGVESRMSKVEGQTNLWNTAHYWGSHATNGYVTGAVVRAETDPKVGANTANYLSKWNGSALVSGSIFDNGNVGIGTASPQAKLTVEGDIFSTQGMDHPIKSNTEFQDNRYLRSGIYQNDGSGLLNAAGNAGALSAWWHVINMHHQYGNGYNAQLAVPLSSGERDIYWRNSDAGNWYEWRKVLSENTAGNVGIGTTSPGAKLDVAGTVKAIDFIGNDMTLGTVGDAINLNVAANAEVGRFEIKFPGWRDVVPNQIGAKIAAIRKNTYANNNALIQGTELAFYTGSGWDATTTTTERLRIDVSGNVGIGTANPLTPLSVQSTGNTELRVDEGGGTSVASLLLGQAAQNPAEEGLRVLYDSASGNSFIRNVYAAGNLYFDTATTGLGVTTVGTRMTILSGGNVGIGTTSPTEKLDVAGTIKATAFTGDGSGLSGVLKAETDPKVGANSANYLSKWNGSALVSGSIFDNGNVGIGTTSPTEKLDVEGTIQADVISVDSTIRGTGRLHIGGGELLYILNTAGVMIGKEWGGNGNLRVQGDSIFDGNVGIGTASPGAKLDVAGTVKATRLIVGNGTATQSYSVSEGLSTTASGEYSHAEGNSTTASGIGSHAEGDSTTASGHQSHAEGQITIAGGRYSHAEGYDTEAGGQASHAEGYDVRALGFASHAGGRGSRAYDDNTYVWSDGSAYASSLTRQYTVYAANGIRLLGGTVYTGNGTVSSWSDERLKQNIAPITNALAKVEQINGVYYELIAKPGKTEVGVIAQDVEQVLPEVVGESDGYKCVDYGKLTALLIEAVKDLKAKNADLTQRLEALENK